jgi:two-component system CheB/CheR fusion protein
MDHLLEGIGIGAVFVDLELRIMRFSTSISKILNLIPTDVGRPVYEIVPNLMGNHDLEGRVRTVLETLTDQVHEVRTRDGRSFLMRVQPYRTQSNQVEGAVISFTDISNLVSVRNSLEKTNNRGRMAVVIQDSNDAIIMQSLEGRILAWNPGASRIFGWSEEDALLMNTTAMIPADLHASELETARKLGRAEIQPPYQTQRITKDGRIIPVSMISTPLVNEAGKVYAIATTERIMNRGES